MTRYKTMLSVVLLGIAFAMATSAHLRFLNQNFHATDDNVYAYLLGDHLLHRDEIDAMHERYRAYFSEGHASEAFLYRMNIRFNAMTNYVYHSTFQYLAAKLLNPLRGHAIDDYPAYMANAMVTGAFVAFFVTLVIVIVALSRLADPLYSAAFCLTVTAYTFSQFLEIPYVYDQVTFHDDVRQALQHTWFFILKPNSQHNLLSFPERSQFYLLLFLVLILRHAGKQATAYWFALPLIFFHRSLSLLALSILIVLDVLLRPHTLREPAVLRPILGYALVYLGVSAWLGGSQLHLPGTAGALLLAGVAVAVVMILVVPGSKPAGIIPAPLRTLAAVRHGFLRICGAYGDVVLLLAGWLLTWPLMFYIVQRADPLQADYFWGRLHGRTWASFGPYVVFCAGILLIQAAASFTKYRRWIASGGVILVLSLLCVSVAHTVAIYQEHRPLDKIIRTLNELDGAHDRNVRIRYGKSQVDEMFMYYSIARSIDTGRRYEAIP